MTTDLPRFRTLRTTHAKILYRVCAADGCDVKYPPYGFDVFLPHKLGTWYCHAHRHLGEQHDNR